MMDRPVGLVVDLETTGLDLHRDRVVEVGVILTDYREVYGALETLVRPPDAPSLRISEKSGIRPEDLEGCPSFADIGEYLLTLLAYADEWVGFGLGFDVRFLRMEFGRLGLSLPLRGQRDLLKSYPRTTLQNACAGAGLDFPPTYPWHRAFGDCAATLRLFRKVRDTGLVDGGERPDSIGVRMG